MPWSARLVLPLALGLLIPAIPATADDQKPLIDFNLLSVQGAVIGKTLTVDQAYGDEHHKQVPAPFSFVVPLSPTKEYEVFVDTDPSGEAWIKINFATSDRQLIENVQFVHLTVDMGELEAREKALARALVVEGLPIIFQGRTGTGRDVLRAIRIGDYDAVEVIAHYDEPTLGRMYTRLVGILNPDGPEGAVAICNIVLARVPVTTPEDFARTRGGSMVASFRYLKP